jgi:hypothetical protein
MARMERPSARKAAKASSLSSATISAIVHRPSAKRASKGSASRSQKPRDLVNRSSKRAPSVAEYPGGRLNETTVSRTSSLRDVPRWPPPLPAWWTRRTERPAAHVSGNNVSDGKTLATGNPNGKQNLGLDVRTLKDATGKPFGAELYAAAQKPEGEMTEVSYMFPRPGADKTPVPKVSLFTRVGDLGCGVGYYK